MNLCYSVVEQSDLLVHPSQLLEELLMSKQQTLEAVRTLREAFRHVNALLDKHLAACLESNDNNTKKAA